MRLLSTIGLLWLACRSYASISPRNYDTHDYFALHLDPSSSPEEVADALGAHLEGPLGELRDHYTFSSAKQKSQDVDNTLRELRRRRRKRGVDAEAHSVVKRIPAKRMARLGGVLWSQKQQLKRRHVKRIPPPPLEQRQGPPPAVDVPTAAELQAATTYLDYVAEKLDIQDPNFKEQWHLFNPIQLGHDLNVTGVWLQGITGEGSITSVIDDGLDMYSEDLKPNYFPEGSHDFNDPGPEPKPRLFDDKHGTRCSGEIAAAKNSVCGVGVAYNGKISGLRILSKVISDEDEAVSINYAYQQNQIYSCSWGPPDDGKTMEAPSVLIKKAIVNGVQNGRNGLGSIFVFAAGNGASYDDNCNFDGYTNSIYSVTVGAISRLGKHPYYSEACSAQLVVAYSSGDSDAIHTTDVGTNACYDGHGGTSAAGPLVAGSIALVLGARPDLNWRDIQYLCIEAAIPIHLDDSDWQDTTIGKKFSHVYGYGKIDTWRLVEAAKTFKSVKPQAWWHSPWLSVFHDIPQGDQGLASSFDVTSEMLKDANLERLEHVTITMNVNHTRRGDVSAELRSPQGIVSHIATARRSDEAASGYNDWTFMSVAHWGESGIGTWTVIVKDSNVNQHTGNFIDWRLNLWGEAIDASIQKLHPLPDEHEDDHEMTAPVVMTTDVIHPPTQTAPPSTPSDHIDRPTKPKPSDASPAPSPPSSTANPTSTSTPSSSFLPGFFPTFGVSAKTQLWIYGSVALIGIFCTGLAIYFYVQRKKRLRNNPRDDYEFEVLDDHDDDGGGGGGTGTRGMNGAATAKGKKGNRRAGELYDAFAGESDEDVFSTDDEADEPYRDAADEKRGREARKDDSRESLAGA